MNYPVRMRFLKAGRAKYISHLDFMRCLQRAICRARLPIAYSNGFHPHMQMSFAVTLPLGFTSSAEIVQIDLTENMPYDAVQLQLNQVLPNNLQVLEAGEAVCALKELAYADYAVGIDTVNPKQLRESFEHFFDAQTILVQKKTKRGMKEVDLKPMVEVIDIVEEIARLTLELRLPAGSICNLNPMLLMDAWQKSENFSMCFPQICRTALLSKERRKFF